MDFKDKKSSNEIINNATISDDEVVASYGPPRSLLESGRGVVFQEGALKMSEDPFL